MRPNSLKAHSILSRRGFAGFGGRCDFVQATALDIIDIAVDRDVAGNERMRPDPAHVLHDARLLVLDRVPLDEMAGRVAAAMMRVRPCLAVERSRREVV